MRVNKLKLNQEKIEMDERSICPRDVTSSMLDRGESSISGLGNAAGSCRTLGCLRYHFGRKQVLAT